LLVFLTGQGATEIDQEELLGLVIALRFATSENILLWTQVELRGGLIIDFLRNGKLSVQEVSQFVLDIIRNETFDRNLD
jgi:hypothetical protein